MRPVECPNKHFYDADRFSECPHCKENSVTEVAVQTEVKSNERKKHHFLFGRKNKKDKENVVVHEDSSSNETVPLDEIDFVFNNRSANNTSAFESEVTEVPDDSLDEIDSTMALYDESELSSFDKESEDEADSDLGLTMMLGFDEDSEEEVNDESDSDLGLTMMLGFDENDVVEDEPIQTEVSPLQQAINDTKSSVVDVDMKTVGFFNVNMEVEPVVGWLVCTFGKHIGESFVLKSGKNTIGRAYGMDVSLPKEMSVSRDRHAIITYEPRKKQFIIQAGESNGLTYINEELVVTYNLLKSYDTIRLGKADFLFVALCSEKFSWEDYLNA